MSLFGVFLILVISAPLMNHIQEFAEQGRDLFEAREAASNTFHWAALLQFHSFYVNFLIIYFFSTSLCCFYFPVHYYTTPSVAGYFYFVYCILFQLYYTSFALAIGYVAPNPPSAAVITALFFSFMDCVFVDLQPSHKYWLSSGCLCTGLRHTLILFNPFWECRCTIGQVQCASKEYNIFRDLQAGKIVMSLLVHLFDALVVICLNLMLLVIATIADTELAMNI